MLGPAKSSCIVSGKQQSPKGGCSSQNRHLSRSPKSSPLTYESTTLPIRIQVTTRFSDLTTIRVGACYPCPIGRSAVETDRSNSNRNTNSSSGRRTGFFKLAVLQGLFRQHRRMHGRPPRALAANVQNRFVSHSVVEAGGPIVSALQVELLAIRPRVVIAAASRQQKA